MVAGPSVLGAPGQVDSARARTAEEAVRRHLRVVIGAPLVRGDTVESTRSAFVEFAADWCARSGVDRDTLVDLGIDRRTLREAGVAQPPKHELLRAWWTTKPFSAADLARRSGWSEPTVRKAIAHDEAAGLLRRAAADGRHTVWEPAD